GLPHDNVRIAVESLIEEIQHMMRRMDMPATLWDAGVTPEQFEKEKENIINSALEDACTPSNPREVDKAGIERILNHITPDM
ncbi:MAG: iron-containing alcohol dehydrogenase, partial [Clostridia bacterium]|nr:iron-containing alcohol dehydrogenase [Clostridia bacterium]